ncbi:hypothetical protein UVI_02063270 [Ustilaginoidea virens]|uniref:Uncharacterized protein n=1 Tax=Ustilaginoidea virens TaxID=1159556 RepID=A0A1B5V8N0_USTVR|nr:hypothetical protein UVI_02063270 [Ustilaginoidea virens]
MAWSRLPSNLWSTVITGVIIPYQELLKDYDQIIPEHYPDLINLRAIGAAIKVLIPHEKRIKSRKLAPRTEPGRLLATLDYRTILQSPATAKDDLIDILTSLTPADLAGPAGPAGPAIPTSPTDLFP